MSTRHEPYARIRRLALRGHFAMAQELLEQLVEEAPSVGATAAVARNDLAVLAALQGDVAGARRQLVSVVSDHPAAVAALENLQLLMGQQEPNELADRSSFRTRVAVVSMLFNWPSTGGGTVHTKELCQFLAGAGYEVLHIIAHHASWGVGQLQSDLGYPHEVLPFADRDWTAQTIRTRFRDAVDQFEPDAVIVTDSWNTKPLLCEAVSSHRYFVRIAALEAICPLNNVRLLFDEQGEFRQCDQNQLAAPGKCRRCVERSGHFSGQLHRAERALAGFEDAEYGQRLREAFERAAGVLVVNPSIADLVRPFAPAVHVIPSGFDDRRFPPPSPSLPAHADGTTRILFAGLPDEPMKGFAVLDQAATRLWEQRQDFEVVVTASPPASINPWLRYVGWQTQKQLPFLMQATDLLVFPTVAQEALGRSAVEAMACSRPVVASRIGGLSWVVEDERTGLLFAPGDVAGLCRQLERLLDDRELRGRLGAAGRAKFEKAFTWESVIQQQYMPLLGEPARKTN
ncbi:2-deoxystreptamine glucosyltransferase [Maioricimonas rarisocia]|uniref:2-deoxystreptamine glucosyltransferase n=1 Tax=Maioricimonas rarisocia TaxID=2528026 RepID=A0A517ZB49_9PLAN|nr:glycosyltransferase family 4 protein [Maioricimonas rarisocia]QDU39661.1 2-deoxystreptamine glucosyltransferase [Maioricimonas rarisocia]